MRFYQTKAACCSQSPPIKDVGGRLRAGGTALMHALRLLRVDTRAQRQRRRQTWPTSPPIKESHRRLVVVFLDCFQEPQSAAANDTLAHHSRRSRRSDISVLMQMFRTHLGVSTRPRLILTCASTLRATLMGGLGVWAVAVALLGTSWLAEGHKSSKRGSAGAAGVDHAATPSPRSTVNNHTSTLPFLQTT